MINDEGKARCHAKYTAAINAMPDDARAENGDEVRRAYLAALVEMGLGHPLDEETLDALADLQKEIQADLPNSGIGGSLVDDAIRRTHALLGVDRFEAIFDSSLENMTRGLKIMALRMELLFSDDPVEIVEAAKFIVASGVEDPDILSLLATIGSAKENESMTRKMALWTLGYIGNELSEIALQAVLDDETDDQIVREHAKEAIEALHMCDGNWPSEPDQN
jgi:hypothetical protein